MARAQNNLGRCYARKREYQKAIDIWLERGESDEAVENAWLFHEIGRCYVEISDYTSAESTGLKSLEAARAANDDYWTQNAAVLVAQSQTHLKMLDKALEHFQVALDMASKLDDRGAAQALRHAISQIQTTDGDGGDDAAAAEQAPAAGTPVTAKEAPAAEKAPANAEAAVAGAAGDEDNEDAEQAAQQLCAAMAKAEFKKVVRDLFKFIDKDNSGIVSQAEWTDRVANNPEMAAQYFGGAKSSDIAKAFSLIDANKSGSLTWEEFEHNVVDYSNRASPPPKPE